MLLAKNDNTMDVSIIPIGTLVTNVIFSIAVCWYLLARALPEMQSRFSVDLKSQREDNYRVLDQERLANERERQIIKESIERERIASIANIERLLTVVSKDNLEMLRRTSEETHATYTLLQDYVRAVQSKGNKP